MYICTSSADSAGWLHAVILKPGRADAIIQKTAKYTLGLRKDRIRLTKTTLAV